MTDPAPSMRRVTAEDLNDDDRLQELYRDAVRSGMWPNSPNSALDFAAFAEKARADDKHGTPGKLFAALVRDGDVTRITQAQETLAMQRWPSDIRAKLVETAGEGSSTLATVGDIEEALTIPHVAYSHAVLMQCFLPQQSAGRDPHTTTHGRASLRVEAGSLTDPNDPGVWYECDVPSGPKARLILPYIIGESVRTASPEVDLGSSLRRFMDRLGVPIAGSNGNALTIQIQNIAAATILLGQWEKERITTLGARLSDAFSFWIERSPNQQGFWTPTMTLSEKFFTAIQEHRVPVNMQHLVQLGRSPRRMDLYAWLSYRAPRIAAGRRVAISLHALQAVFAPSIRNHRHFRHRLRHDLEAIHTVYPDFQVEIDGDVLWLKRSPPPVPFRKVIHRAPEQTV